MIKPQDAIIQCRIASADGKHPGVCEVSVRGQLDLKSANGCHVFTWGRCFAGWKDLSDEQIFRALEFLILEMVEFYGVPAKQARDAIEKSVAGYLEWSGAGAKILRLECR